MLVLHFFLFVYMRKQIKQTLDFLASFSKLSLQRFNREAFSIMRDWTKSLLVVFSLAVLFWPGIQHHWEMSKDPYFAPFDAAQYIPAFFKFDPTDPIPTTYIKEYFLNAVCPLLYKWSTQIGAQFVDLRHFQIGMMYIAYAVFIGVMGRLGWILGGALLSFAVVALTSSAWIFIGLGFIGGSPRMYAYPLISLVLYSLIRDRPNLLAVTVVLGGLLYPIVALIGGLCLTGWMTLKPLFNQGLVSNWSVSHRLLTVGLTGILAISTLVPLIIDAKPYGRRVVDADIGTYPEAGADGNYRIYDQLPYKLLGNEWITYFLGPMMYASDYPHWDMEWPHSVSQVVRRKDISGQTKQKILADNAKAFYRFT